MVETIALLFLAGIVALIAYAGMVPGAVINATINAKIAADTTWLANVAASKMHLVAAPFTPSLALTYASLTEASFTGYASVSPVVGAQTAATDPITGLPVIFLNPPVGGFRFTTTSAVGLPQTIYGWVLTDNVNANVLASGLFSTPIVLTLSGQIIEVPDLLFTVNAVALS